MWKKGKITVLCFIMFMITFLYSLYFTESTHWARVVLFRQSSLPRSPSSNWVILSSDSANDIINHDIDVMLLVLVSNKQPIFTKKNNLIVASKSGILKSDIQLYDVNPEISLRSLGVLYAINKGALLIFETDSASNINFPFTSPPREGLVKFGSKSFNPYQHFGVYSHTAVVPKLNYLLTSVRSYIEHVVTDDVNMVDPLWGPAPLLVKSPQNKYTYDKKSPPVFLAKGVFTPYISKNTLFRQQSFWCMYFPIVDQPEYGDLYRNLICQRLMWEIGGTVGFYPPTTQTTSDDNIAFNDNSSQIRNKVIKLVTFLSDWSCDSTLQLYECMIELVKHLVRADILKHVNKKLVKTWISTLHNIEYIEPERAPVPEITTDTILKKFDSNFLFYPPQEPRPQKYYLDKLSQTCPNTSYIKQDISSRVSTPSDLVLIVVFNFPHYNNIPIVQTIYGQTFSQIIFCGASKKEFETQSRKYVFTGSFVEIDIGQGYYFYKCMSQVMKMNHNVTGYLLIGDDVLINPWNVQSFPQDKIWLINSTTSLDMDQVHTVWGHWHAWYGQPALKKMFTHLQSNHSEKYLQFKSILEHNTGHPNSIYYGGSDIAYVPTRLREETKFYFDFFTNHSIFLEITFHTVLYGIERKENTFTLIDGYMWGADKADYALKFNPKKRFFIHPYKIGPMLKTDHGKRFFCNVYFPNLFLSKIT